MLQAEIHKFLIEFFQANHCEITEQGPGHLIVQLTIEMDKELMNRPFYWHYLEKTGGIPNPMSLTLITDQNLAPEELKGDFIHFGSPRLHQIFTLSKKLSRHIRLFEKIQISNGQAPLFPWLCLNVNISYECDRKKDQLHSIGLNLINGTIMEDFYDMVQKVALTPKIPDYTFTLSPIIRYQSGIGRLKNHMQMKITQDNHSWAVDAMERWNKDLALLDHFYEDKMEEEQGSYEAEKEALRLQYEPRIHVRIINGGLFYLTKDAI